MSSENSAAVTVSNWMNATRGTEVIMPFQGEERIGNVTTQGDALG
jgi:hypothetical protein